MDPSTKASTSQTNNITAATWISLPRLLRLFSRRTLQWWWWWRTHKRKEELSTAFPL